MGLISRALDNNKKGEVHTRYHFDEASDEFVIERIQDVEPILKENQEKRLRHDGYNSSRDMVHVGQIPLVVIEKIMKEQKWDPLHPSNVDRLHALLDDPEYAKFRTSEGRIARAPIRQYFKGSTGKIESRVVAPIRIVRPAHGG